jgi:hypothetical protein
MTGSGIHFTQISLHHNKSALVLLARSMAAIHTGIVTIQRPQIVNGAITGLGSCRMLYKANTADGIRAYIISKGTDATLITSVQLW